MWHENTGQITSHSPTATSCSLSNPLTAPIWSCIKFSYACGIVVLKISNVQLQVLSQISGVNFSPFRITTFSKQFVPDRANCSLSRRKEQLIYILAGSQWTLCVTYLLHTYLAVHTSKAGRKYHPTVRHWVLPDTAWTRHRWHKAHGCRLSSSTQLSGVVGGKVITLKSCHPSTIRMKRIQRTVFTHL